MNYTDFDKKLTQVRLGKIIHHLELYQHKHNHELPKDMNIFYIKRLISNIDIKSPNKRESIKNLENNNIDELIKSLKKLKNDVGLG